MNQFENLKMGIILKILLNDFKNNFQIFKLTNFQIIILFSN